MDPTDKPWGDVFLETKIFRHATLYAWHPLTRLTAGAAIADLR
jgi:hypothetical protein